MLSLKRRNHIAVDRAVKKKLTDVLEFVEARALLRADADPNLPPLRDITSVFRVVLRELDYHEDDIDAGLRDWHESRAMSALNRNLLVERICVVAASAAPTFVIAALVGGSAGVVLSTLAGTCGIVTLALHLMFRGTP